MRVRLSETMKSTNQCPHTIVLEMLLHLQNMIFTHSNDFEGNRTTKDLDCFNKCDTCVNGPIHMFPTTSSIVARALHWLNVIIIAFVATIVILKMYSHLQKKPLYSSIYEFINKKSKLNQD